MDERKKRMNTLLHVKHLQYEVQVLKGMLKEHDTGHIHTAISVLEHRIEELESSLEEVLDSSYPDGVGYWK